ncbi:MAG: hypothetical protein RLY56_290 [Pseudomonadota bacterium]|jgi:hypothetical protein
MSKRPRRAVAATIALVVVAAGAFFLWPDSTPRSAKVFQPPEVKAPRLTPEQYRAAITDVFGAHIDLGGRLEPVMRDGGLLVVGASSVSVTPAGMEQFDAMAEAISEQVLLREENRRVFLSCTPAKPDQPDDRCAAQFLTPVGERLFRRPLTEVELRSFVTAAAAAAKALGNFHEGLALSLAAMLTSPQFLFRIPVIEEDPDRSGGYRLDAYSRAARLSFFLWNTGPDAELLRAAREGELDSDRGLRRQVDRMMASPRLEEGVRAFFYDMLRFDTFETLSKDPTLFPKFSRREMADAQEQTLRTLVHLLLDEQGDYRDAFTTKKTFLTPSLAAIYQVPLAHDGPNGGVESWEPFEFSAEDPRAGILSHASFTALHSPPGRTSPTDRGKALREVLMCQNVPAPPPDVQFTVVQNTADPIHKTVRQRLIAHSTVPSCAGCHRIMDPMGLALENFDGAGEFRMVENGQPIDTSGDLDGVEFSNSLELAQVVRDNPAIPSCLVKRMTAYAFGQDLTQDQRVFLKQMRVHFRESGFKVPELMRAIVTSPEFFQAAPTRAAVPVDTITAAVGR